MILNTVIQKMYGLSDSILLPLFWTGLSMFPGLVCSIISSFYNVTGKNTFSNMIIIFRMIIMVMLGLKLSVIFNISLFSYMFLAEVLTLVAWFIIIKVYHLKNKTLSEYLLMDNSLEKEGRVLNFSLGNSVNEICNASEKIIDFCNNNGMNSKQIMTIQLAIEEILTLITEVNNVDSSENILKFDIRTFCLKNENGIRIRYTGKEFNPLIRNDDKEMYMGIDMIEKISDKVIYQRTFGVNTIQVTICV